MNVTFFTMADSLLIVIYIVLVLGQSDANLCVCVCVRVDLKRHVCIEYLTHIVMGL